MKKLLNEEINYKVEKNINGTPIAYIDTLTSENIYPFKDIIKKYGAKWDTRFKRWYWLLSNDNNESQNILNKFVNPCIDELTSLETPKNGVRRKSQDIKEQIQKVVNELNKIINAPSNEEGGNEESISEIKNKVASFKEKIVKITSSEEFKAVMGPIIKFKQAFGHQYSFSNLLLIYLQDKKATMVKPKSKWIKLNRYVIRDAPSIALYTPIGLESYSAEEKKYITQEFLLRYGVKSVKELTTGQKEELNVQLNGKNPKGFALIKGFYDHRFTKPIRGRKDLAPEAGKNKDVEWFDDKSPVNEKTEKLYNAVISAIKSVGLSIDFVNDLGGARGVSKSGSIDILKDAPKNIGTVSTIIHEFSHELLHQRYLSNKSKDEFSQFFVGKNGRSMVEQQAELSAWIVCQYFGFEMPTNVNYMGCWGMDDKAAPIVFDTVANTSSYIIEKISNFMKNNIKEGIEDIKPIISGEDVANMIGAGDIYRKNKVRTIGENEIRKMVRDAIKERYETVQWQHFNNGPTRNEMLKDAIEAIEMSDNQIDFYEWYDGFEEWCDVESAEEIWNEALTKVSSKSNYMNEASYDFRRGYFDEEDFSSKYPSISDYTHFAVNKKTNLIVNGWDYRGYDADELKQFKKDYFIVDLVDNDFNPKEYKILTRQGCLKQGINPDDEMNCWSNRGDIPLKDEKR